MIDIINHVNSSMILQTKLSLHKEIFNPISYNSKILLFGSCFSENIIDKLSFYKFQSYQNPFGILFHPKAIENLITNALNEKEYTEEDVFFLNERWHCFDAHSSLSSVEKNELLKNLNEAISNTKKQIQNATHILITLGTSWVYRFIEKDTIVANCHKIQQRKFLKEILSVDEVAECLEAITALIQSVNKKAVITFTVSPVRHLKDGFTQNQQSKSHLIAAINQIVEPRNNTHYFPSYEIMMDELRDYRFYADDMIHPNQTAINYIWEKFVESWISDDSHQIMKEVATIQSGLNHRPFNSKSTEHKDFLNTLEHKIFKVKATHPFIDF